MSQIKDNWKDLAESVVKTITEYVGGTYRPADASNYYIVKSGDTLWGIAREFNTTVNELKDLNNLTTNALSIGQYIKLPSIDIYEEESEYYIVKSGDTLWGIARANNITVDELKRINNLTSNTLSIGQKLLLSPEAEEMPITNTYTVVSGDSLYKIANNFGTTVSELKSLNNLSSNLLSIGQVLLIPQTDYQTYTVVSGDSLYKIARQFNTTVDELKALNNLTSNLLSIGQTLKIPK